LKGIIRKSSVGTILRSGLIIFQFIISIILILGTLMIFKQQKYLENKDLGFNKENILVTAVHNDYARTRLETFKDELIKINEVKNATGSSMVPGDPYLFVIGTYPQGFSRDNVFQMDNYLVDSDYFDTYEIKIVKGRGFLPDNINDISNSILINETAANRLNWDEPVGKSILLSTSDSTAKPLNIVGVYKDIHHRSLYSVIEPTFIQHVKTSGPISNRARRFSIRIDSDNIPETIEKIKQKWTEFFPDHPFYYFFLKETYDGYHNSEQKLGALLRSFSILAIIIASLGLFGLASYISEQRTKEIGIRKAVGSNVSNIIILLCTQFIRLVLIANIISWPIAYLFIKKWLQNFVYHVDQEIDIYLLTILLSVLLALITVGSQSLKASRLNPSDTLRYE
ncbi:ABC transporter permease, partial [Bacteroidota bacterium]